MGRRSIHLLYVPTMACNLACSYCYLGAQTGEAKAKDDAGKAVSTLRFALGKFKEADVLPFNVSLHGGEATMMPEAVLDELMGIIAGHYLENHGELTALGHKKSAPHLKTNLYRFEPLLELFKRRRASISASVDLPLRAHAERRKTKGGHSWLERTEANLRLLASYPHGKKISCTLSAEHVESLDEIVSDIWRLNDEFGLDMNAMNVMFAFASELNGKQQAAAGVEPPRPASGAQMVRFMEGLREAFKGTALEPGSRSTWFEEFTPSYCSGAVNCGEKFFLLQSDGEVFSCPRGQGVEALRFGNIFSDSVDAILEAGRRKVAAIHQSQGFDASCRGCSALSLCNTGCPAVKLQSGSGKSYTCDLQRALYAAEPERFPLPSDQEAARYARAYALRVHPGLAFEASGEGVSGADAAWGGLSREFSDPRNALPNIVAADPLLKWIYEPGAFALVLNGKVVELESQLRKARPAAFVIGASDSLSVHFGKPVWEAGEPDALRNTLHMQALRDTPVVYGDEARTKQEHLFTHQAYLAALAPSNVFPGGYCFDLGPLLALHRSLYKRGVLNNFFFATSALREAHYAKQKANAFYHAQAMNLPFHNFEFHYIPDGEGG